jgi:hypothetical protein
VLASSYTVTPSVTGSGTTSPSAAQTVNTGQTTAFTLAPNAGNHLVNVTGTCGGTLNGNTFTTSPVTADCTVIANFAAAPPVAAITPNPMTFTLDAGATSASPLHIGNTGGGTLMWSIAETPAACASLADVPWLSENPASGSVSGGNSQDSSITVDATSLAAGTYSADLCVTTNDPTHADVAVPVNVTVNPVIVAPTLAKAFAPASVQINVASAATLTLGNANTSADTLMADLTDTLPVGLVVATPTNAATTCTGGTVVATAGAGSFALASGAGIPASGSCTVTVDVVAAIDGGYTNLIPAGALVTNVGSNANPASATLTVTPVPGDRIFCDGFDGVACAPLRIDGVASASGGAPTWLDGLEIAAIDE